MGRSVRFRGVGLSDGTAEGVIERNPRVVGAFRAGPGVPSGVWSASVEEVEAWLSGLWAALPAAGVVSEPRRPRVATPFPLVGGLPSDLFEEGETVRVDGRAGTVDLEGVTGADVVTSFLEDGDGRILLLKRSPQVGSFRGRWAAVSGYLETAFPLDQALQEIREETRIPPSEVDLVAEGSVVYARSGPQVFVVHPFRFRLRAAQPILLDWEHTEGRWVDPREIATLDTVPHLDTAWARVAPVVRGRPKG